MKNLFFNPFTYLGGYLAFFYGITIILITSWLSSMNLLHFDGIIDVHFGGEAPRWLFFAENLLNLFSITLVYYLAGLLFSGSNIRFVDVIATQSLARAPLLIPAIFSFSLNPQKIMDYFISSYIHHQKEIVIGPSDMIIFAILVILILAAVIWMIALMYNAFTVSLNMKGTKAVIVFIIGLVIAEIISKVIYFSILKSYIVNDPFDIFFKNI